MKRFRSMLFCPANNKRFLQTSNKQNADYIIFDLEDSIAISEKENARNMLVEALKSTDMDKSLIFARINALSSPFGKADVTLLIPAGLRNIRLPMVESDRDVIELSEILDRLELQHNIPRGTVKILAAIETPKGVLNALSIATCSKRLVGISFGAEDYTNCLGVSRSKDPMQTLFAKSMIVNAAQASGIVAIDTVFSDLADEEGLLIEAHLAKELGFSGKSCIHPRQVSSVNEVFSPSTEEIAFARKVLACAEEAEKNSLGVTSLNGKMIDTPIIEKAKKILRMEGR